MQQQSTQIRMALLHILNGMHLQAMIHLTLTMLPYYHPLIQAMSQYHRLPYWSRCLAVHQYLKPLWLYAMLIHSWRCKFYTDLQGLQHNLGFLLHHGIISCLLWMGMWSVFCGYGTVSWRPLSVDGNVLSLTGRMYWWFLQYPSRSRIGRHCGNCKPWSWRDLHPLFNVFSSMVCCSYSQFAGTITMTVLGKVNTLNSCRWQISRM